MLQTKVVEEIRTHILCLVCLFWKSCGLRDNVEKYGRPLLTAHAHCVPVN